MKFTRSIKIAYKSLTTHKLRSFLTILGIVIGITSVILVFSAGEGLKGLVLSQIEAWGTDMIEVEIKVPSASQTSTENATGMAMGVSITTLKESDAEAIKSNPNVTNVYSTVIGQETVTYLDQTKVKQIWGTNASFIDIDAAEVETGRFFTAEEDKSLAKVVIIGQNIVKDFFGNQDPIGKTLKIGKNNFKVIGVMGEQGTIMYMDMDDWIYMPLRTLQKLVMGIDHVSFIMGKMADKEMGDVTTEELTTLLRDRHNITDPDKDDFAVITMEEAMNIWDSVMGGITLLLMSIVAISLIVGGVGIMNIMLVSVTERTYEIGLRKAVGASRGKIMSQFLWEAVTLTTLGGIVGIVLGLGISFLTYLGAQSQGFDWPFVIDPVAILVSVSVSVAIGLIFGIFPARKAANLDPIVALTKD